MMKKFTLLFLLAIAGGWSHAQTLTIVEPEGLSAPYEVSPGTEITFQWSYFGDPPTSIFTHDEEPVLPDFGTDENWTQSTDYVDNMDGTYNFTITANEELWVWAGFYQTFLGTWAYSEVYHIEIASSVEITFEDGIVCPDGLGTETLTASDSYDSYQWFLDNEPVDGATDNIYAATMAGAYKVEVTDNGESIFSNTLNVDYAEVEIEGSFITGSNELEISATEGFDTYTWYSGNAADDLSPIDGATASTYTATLEVDEVYYAVSATLNGCTVDSEARPASLGSFQTPMVTLNSEPNEFGNICVGDEVGISVNEDYESYLWYQDGFDTFHTSPLFTVSQSYEEGFYHVVVNPIGWPEIEIESNQVEVDFFSPTSPNLIANGNSFCAGDEVNVTLGDEGYDYTWYEHSDFNYTEEDIVEVTGSTFTFTFVDQTNVTVVATYEGCSSNSSMLLNNNANTNLSISFIDWDDQYLCTDSTSEIAVSQWNVDDFENFQWFEEVEGEQVAIDGAVGSSYLADHTGVFSVQADLIACEDVEVVSQSIEIFDYTERELFIYAEDEELCMGEATNLVIPDAESWQNIQWFDMSIEIGQQGYEEMFNPLIGGGSTGTQEVSEFTSYLVKARHESCPTGIKITSNIVDIRPKVNPTISVDPNYGIDGWNLALYDSIASYLYCSGETVTVSLPGTYESYTWHLEPYAGDDDYVLGDEISGADGPVTDVTATGADWVTAVVDSAGCIGVSDPVLIDTWVFSPPTITSYNNAELCGEGDSTLIHVSFPGNYANVEWYLDGNLMPDENNDSLYATQPGMYVVTVYREECPDFGMSSGVGPIVTFLEAEILENDSVIYAVPQLGQYTYQWYLDGEPIDAPAQTPWLLYKEDMEDGTYTVDISNPEPCTSTSAPYEWISDQVNELHESVLNLYPNPTTGILQLKGINHSEIRSMRILDITGKEVLRLFEFNEINISPLAPGVYFLEVRTQDSLHRSSKILKQ